MSIRRGALVCGIGFVTVLAVAAVVVGVIWVARSHAGSAKTDEQDPDEGGRIRVKTIHPQRDPSFVISVEEPAYVEPYYQTDILSQVAGRIKYLQVNIGDPIQQGELLVQIDVPDLDQKVTMKEAIVEQRIREEQLAQRKAVSARQHVDVAKYEWDVKKALVPRWEATCDLRKSRYDRFLGARKGELVQDEVVEEERKSWLEAKADCAGARAASNKAEADWEEAKANSEAAIADVKLKQALIDVARKDRDQAQADADYAKITAYYDGVVIRRDPDVSPGSFVQNATTARTAPLLTVARTDIVTVFTRIPDNFAPFVDKNIDAIIRMDQLPGEVIRGKVSRFSPSVENKDRRMRVEVDLYNGSAEDYRKFVANAVATSFAPVGTPRVLEGLSLRAAAHMAWGQHGRSRDAFPLFPKITGEKVAQRRHNLLPGMTGYLRLNLANDNSYLLPSGAVISRAGKMYIVQVKNGTAHWLPVEVQADFGSLVKVAITVRRVNPKTGLSEIVQQGLTGEEEIVVSGQGELAEGQAVEPNLVEWPKSP